MPIIVNRRGIREELAAVLTANIVGADPLPADAVYDHLNPNFDEGASRVVLVVSSGSLRNFTSLRNEGNDDRFLYDILKCVRKPDDSGGYTQQDAENASDDLEFAVAQTLGANRHRPGFWTTLNYEDSESDIDTRQIPRAYRVEITRIVVVPEQSK